MKNIVAFLCVMTLILASFTAGVQYQRGDVNQDGSVSITDVTTLIDYLLTGAWPGEDQTATEMFTVNGVSFKMVAVEGGTFTMGAADDDPDAFDFEKPAHEVTLSPYSIGQTEVTQELWQAVMGTNPSSFVGDMQRPVEQVSWEDCQEFISRLNALTGKTFRLPTEAEWEFAARGGNKASGYIYAGSDVLDDVAWYYANSYAVGVDSPNYGTHIVGSKHANELGIYDMCGNVFEWCQDWYGSYSGSAQTNPTGPTSGSDRVNRGGSWCVTAEFCRVTFRFIYSPTFAYYDLGLRLAL